MKRIVTAAALVPVAVYVVLWANHWIFLSVLAVVTLLCYHEYDSIAAGYGFGSPGPIGFAAGLAVLLLPGDAWLPVAFLAMIALGLAMRTDDLAKSLPRAGLLAIGVLYVFGCWRAAIPLREASPHWLMFALLVTWAGDVAGYYVGRAFGRHSLAPFVSPNKTWEGSVASMIASVLIAGGYLATVKFVFGLTIPYVDGFTLPYAVAVAALANVAGQVGDLAESAMKRGAAVKDSGDILPGHGGFLDRVDSTLFALPVIAAYVRFVAPRL